MQVKLLRVLQEHSIQRIGARKEVPVNVRIVAATNQDLQLLVSQGKFRLDLFYRLNVIPVRLPALRERAEDIRHLVRYYLNQLDQGYQRNVNITPEAMQRLTDHPWPGNIRQLRNVLERLILLAEGATISEKEVMAVLQAESHSQMQMQAPPQNGLTALPTPAMSSNGGVRAYHPVQESDRAAIETALLETGGNKSRAAQKLGLTLRQFNYRMQVMGIAAGKR
jgi:Nif-specific regulatory protein